MFTGIVSHLGEVRRCQPECLELALPAGLTLPVGGSVAVNGVCLTATRVQGRLMTADVSPETLKKTALGALQAGEQVNLERPCRPGGFLDGHVVQGHVDAVGSVLSIAPEGNSFKFTFQVDAGWDRYLVEKGAVAVDGISLTVFDVGGGKFSVAVIPHTFERTNLKHKRPGAPVNVEFDVLGKYTEKLLRAYLDSLRGNHGV